jgi:hypothetical protein
MSIFYLHLLGKKININLYVSQTQNIFLIAYGQGSIKYVSWRGWCQAQCYTAESCFAVCSKSALTFLTVPVQLHRCASIVHQVLRLGLGKRWTIPGKGVLKVFSLQTQSRNFTDKSWIKVHTSKDFVSSSYSNTMALNSSTSGGLLAGIDRSRTQDMEFSISFPFFRPTGHHHVRKL